MSVQYFRGSDDDDGGDDDDEHLRHRNSDVLPDVQLVDVVPVNHSLRVVPVLVPHSAEFF